MIDVDRVSQLFLGIAGHEKNLEIGPALARLADHRRAVHPRHHDVADQEVDRLAAANDFQRVFAVVRANHRIAVASQRAFGHAAHHWLVLDQENRAAAPQFILLRLADPARRCCACLFAMDRQIDDEAGSLPHFGVGEDESARLLDDAIDGGKPEPRSLADLLGGEERLKNLAQDTRRNAAASVGNRESAVVSDRQDVGA